MMKRNLFVIGCALTAFAGRLCGRGLAVNEVPVTVGLPAHLDPEKVLARKKALIALGTDPLLAEKFAIDAEQQQLQRDSDLSVTAPAQAEALETEEIASPDLTRDQA